MSFSSTPLGQGRRLDHHTFLNKKPQTSSNLSAGNQIPRPNSPPRRHIPASYAYGAPTLGTRSPPKPTASSASLDDESEQPALVRFARLKQRELGQARSAPDLGSRTTTTVPQPEKWSVKDTSVQIASAFHQAATSTSLEDNNNTVHPTNTNEDNNNNTSTEIMNPNDAWASGTTRKNVIPRSTSVEYEKETHSTVNRRLGAPPSRLNSSRAPKPLSKTTSLRHVPSSEGEGEDHHDQHLSHNTSNTSASSNSNGRAKSPFFEAVKRYAPTTFFMRAHESDDEAQSGAGAVNASTSVSYDYSAEEREYQAQQQQQQLSTASAKSTGTKKTNSGPVYRRNRISVDNKAYRPTVSDLEESDEDFEEGERRRRRKAKKSAPGGPLTTLPVAGYDKRRKKRRSGTKGNGVEEEGEEESSELSEGQEEEQSKVSEQRSVRGATPIQRALSARSSVPPPSRVSVPPRGSVPPEIPNYDSMPPDTSGTDIENALAPVRETEEEYLETDLDAEHHTRSSFSIGTLLGKGVHWGFTTCWRIIATIVSLFASITGAIARAARFVVNILLAPLRLLFRIDSAAVSQIGKYALVALGLYLSWAVLQSGLFTIERTPVRSYPSPYLPPDVPPVDISELSERLLRLESALGALSMASERSRTYIEGDAKHQAELAGRIGALESHVQKDGSKAKDLETKLKTSTKQGLDAVKQEMQTLRAQIQAQQEREVRHTGSHLDEEARAKLRALEERVGTVEGGVKEALELGKSSGAVGAGGAAVVSGSMAAWWNKLASGKSTGMTIKSSDGQDVTGLIRHLVDSAVLTSSKDMLARPDYAMYSGGASVIPSLTSDTFEVVPDTFVGKMIGTITGLGQAIGRPPVTALNHELHTGYCWPFAGMKGQLGVMLAVPTVISDVTIDHAPVEVALDLRSAPRHMQLWGLLEGKDNIEKYMEWQKQRQARREEARAQAQAAGQPLVDLTHDDDEERYPYPDTLPKSPPYVPLADFVYNIHAPNYIQTFPIREEIKELGLDFGVVVLMVDNNWGKEEFTCLYRMRIHGERLGGIPEPLGEEWASGVKALEVAPFFGNHESMTVEDSV